MRREGTSTFAGRAEDGLFAADRIFVDGVRPSLEDDTAIRFTMAVYPLASIEGLPIDQRWEQVMSQRVEETRHFGRVPDWSGRRTISTGAIGGDPINSYIGFTGFHAYFVQHPAENSRFYPHWWHANLCALLRWSARDYAKLAYNDDVGIEFELDGIKRKSLLFGERTFESSSHQSLEDNVLVRERTSLQRLAAEPDTIGLHITQRLCAAFNWQAGLQELARALATA